MTSGKTISENKKRLHNKFGTEVSNMKKQWVERGNSDNSKEAVKPIKFSKHSEVMTMKQLKDKEISHIL